MSESVLAVDIGNTRTDIGIVDLCRVACVRRKSIPTSEAKEHLPSVLSTFQSELPSPGQAPVCASIVNSSLRAELSPALEDLFGNRFSWVSYDGALPITLIYDEPQTLGTDRLANLLYCNRFFRGTSTVIIDSGTTITVDYLERGFHFAGGAIMPGLMAQLESLNTATAELPLLPFYALKNAFPGISTVDCIKSGIMYGCAGGISRLVEEFRKQVGGDVRVLATGGAWPVIENLIDFSYQYVPDLTLIGVGIYAETVSADAAASDSAA